ncbi:hypothetical protein ABT168_30945 [Streptomyces sp. NPDC001793]|uniref:hypothetical protein n=1 Tax=Streptomyces sp. NPDC001793 TaxID=3154657 RepID=UPI0033232EE1
MTGPGACPARKLGADTVATSADALTAAPPRGWAVVTDCTGNIRAIEDGLTRPVRGGTFQQFGRAPHPGADRGGHGVDEEGGAEGRREPTTAQVRKLPSHVCARTVAAVTTGSAMGHERVRHPVTS